MARSLFKFWNQFQIKKKFFNTLAATFDPKVNVTALATQRVWVKPGICSSLQDSRAPSLFAKNLRQSRRFRIHAFVHVAGRFGMGSPAHQQRLWREIFLGNFWERRKDNIQNSLTFGFNKQFFPFFRSFSAALRSFSRFASRCFKVSW